MAAGACGDRGQGIAYEALIASTERKEGEREQAEAERRELADKRRRGLRFDMAGGLPDSAVGRRGRRVDCPLKCRG